MSFDGVARETATVGCSGVRGGSGAVSAAFGASAVSLGQTMSHPPNGSAEPSSLSSSLSSLKISYVALKGAVSRASMSPSGSQPNPFSSPGCSRPVGHFFPALPKMLKCTEMCYREATRGESVVRSECPAVDRSVKRSRDIII